MALGHRLLLVPLGLGQRVSPVQHLLREESHQVLVIVLDVLVLSQVFIATAGRNMALVLGHVLVTGLTHSVGPPEVLIV